MRTREVLSLSVPIGMTKEIQRVCKTERKNRSQLFRDALQSYLFIQRWRTFQRETIAKARAMGVYTEDDVEKSIQQFRSAKPPQKKGGGAKPPQRGRSLKS